MYDPRGDYQRNQAEELLSWLCAGRSESPSPNVCLQEGSRVLARELAHTRRIFIDRHDNAGALYIPHRELDTIVDAAYDEAHMTISALKRGVDHLFHHNPDIRELAKKHDPERIITFGAAGSALSHLGQFRRSGDPYAKHPWESVMIADIAERRAFPDGLPDEFLINSAILRYIIYGHDEWEDDMSSKKGERNRSFLASNKVHMTPLVHYVLLQEECGVSEEVADYTSDGLVRLSKTVGPSGRREWKPYIIELASPAPVAPKGFEGTVTTAKDDEMHHNADVDKDSRPSRRKLSGSEFQKAHGKYVRRRRDYKWASGMIHGYLEQIDGYAATVAKNISGVSRKDVDRYKVSSSLTAALEPDMLVTAYFAANEPV
jgi:hypothetical protein